LSTGSAQDELLIIVTTTKIWVMWLEPSLACENSM